MFILERPPDCAEVIIEERTLGLFGSCNTMSHRVAITAYTMLSPGDDQQPIKAFYTLLYSAKAGHGSSPLSITQIQGIIGKE